MAHPRVDRALELVAQIGDALEASDPGSKVHVTLDAREIPSAARHGVVVIEPPTLTPETFSMADIQWEVSLIAGPADNMLEAWKKLDAILAAMFAANLPIATATPGTYAPLNGASLPAYVVTLDPETTYLKEETA